MTAAQYRAAIKKLGLNQRAAAKLFLVNERTSRRWAKHGTSKRVDMLIKAALAVEKRFNRRLDPMEQKNA